MIYGNGLMLITNYRYVQNLFGYSPEYSVLPSETLESLYLTIQCNGGLYTGHQFFAQLHLVTPCGQLLQ